MHWLALLFHEDCGFPKFPVAIMIPQNLFMMALFGDFYYKSYVMKAKKREPVVTASIENPNDTNGKMYTNGDSRHRYTNGTAAHTNGDAKNGYMNGNSNGNAMNGQTNGNVMKHLNAMS